MKKKIGIAAALFLLILPELPCMAHGAGASVSSAAVGVRANVCLYQELILGVTGTALSGRPQAESVQKIYGVYPSGSFVAAIGADIPEGWEAVIWESEAEIPDWGIEIRAEGKENARIMVTEYSVRIMQSFRSFGAGYPEIQCNDSGCRCIPL